jgi:TolA-binding protein
MSHCAHQLDNWLKEGRPDPMPEGLRRHLASCLGCRATLAQIDEVRSWYAASPPGIDERAAQAIRFRLQAEARNRRSSDEGRSVSPLRSLRWAPIGIPLGVVLVAALIGGASLLRPSPPIEPSFRSLATPAVPSIEVEPGPAAIYRPLGAPPHTAYRVRHGWVAFVVPPRRGLRLRVVVGGDAVVVRGTVFRVQAFQDRLTDVRVERGAVSVELAGEKSLTLAAGESWQRPRIASRPAPADDIAGRSPRRSPATRMGQAPRAARRTVAPNEASGSAEGVPRPEATTATPASAPPRPAESFHQAWRLLREGRADAAAYAFDAWLERHARGERRADVLFWSAMAHRRAGRRAVAIERLSELLRLDPDAWHATEARRQLRQLRAGQDSP